MCGGASIVLSFVLDGKEAIDGEWLDTARSRTHSAEHLNNVSGLGVSMKMGVQVVIALSEH